MSVPARRPAAVMWDMDGTLVDSEKYWQIAETELASEHGLVWDQEMNAKFVGKAIPVAARGLRDFGVNLPVGAIVDRLVGSVNDQLRQECPWRPGSLELVMELAQAGIPQALVTMSYRSQAEAVGVNLPENAFTVMVTGDEVSAGKPDPEPYLTAARLLGLAPEDCLALEDSTSGSASANAAGTTVIIAPWVVPVLDIPGVSIIADMRELDVEVLSRIHGGHPLRTAGPEWIIPRQD